MSQWDRLNRAARETAMKAAAGVSPRPTAVVELSSRGRVLVVGRDGAWSAAQRMAEPLRPVVIGRSPRPFNMTRVSGVEIGHETLVTLDGHLGAFVLRCESAVGEPVRLEADLVLDLDQPPLISGRLPPTGYFHAAGTPAQLETLLSRLVGMVGVFEKPTYYEYDPHICAHQRNGVTACTRCIDACPTEAIVSHGEGVVVNPNLCQGLGSCSTACPSGAIRYSYPAPGDALLALRSLLETYRGAGGMRPRLLLHDDAMGAGWVDQVYTDLPGAVMAFRLEDIACLGLEAWLCVLAMGALDLSLLVLPATPPKVVTLLEEQIGICSALLDGLGLDTSRVRLLRPEDRHQLSAAFGAETGDEPVTPATFALSDEKRAMAFWALDHLQLRAPALRPLINLPVGAPFGRAEVSGKACTLCLSCVGACPGGALQDGYDQPELRFIESNCLQCGMCTRVCPEDAIWITPRMLFDAEERRRSQVLYQEPAFECVACGKPFATRSVIDRMLGRLQGHHMFRDQRAKRRLMMCEDCRVVDIAQDPEAMERGLRTHGHQ